MAPQKLSPAERMQMAARAAEATATARRTVADNWQRLKSGAVALWDWYRRPAPWTDFRDLTGKYSGSLQYSDWELSRFTDSIKKRIPDKLRREAITNYIEARGDLDVLRERAQQSKPEFRRGYELAQHLTPEERTLADNIRNFHDAELNEAIKAGILESGLDDYVQHIWKRGIAYAKKLRAEINYSSLQPNPSFARERLFGTYFDGEQAGFSPVDKDVAFLTAAHHRAFAKAVAARGYIRSLLDGKGSDGRPLAWVSGGGQVIATPEGDAKAYVIRPNSRLFGDKKGAAQGQLFDDVKLNTGDYVRVDSPALRRHKWVARDADGKPIYVQGDILIHPEVAQKVKNNLGNSAIRQYAVGRAALGLTREFKNVLLSLSGFHQTTTGVHASFHRIDPVRDVPALDLDNPRLRALVDHGLMVADYDAMSAFSEGVGTGGIIDKVPGIGPRMQAYTSYLFRDYIPRLKAKLALAALERNERRYGGKLSQDQIYAMTAEQANAALGELPLRMMGRNPTFQDVLRLTLLAPDFLESRARVVSQAARPYGREQLAALFLGAAVMYTGARIMNQLLDGDPHWDRPFSLVIGKREYSLRTIQGDILNLVTDARSFAFSRLNPTLARTAVEGVTGRDAQGRKRSIGDQLLDLLRAHVPIPAQGFFSQSGHTMRRELVDGLLKAVGISDRTYETPAEKKARQFVQDSMSGRVAVRPQSDLMRRYRAQMTDGDLDLKAVNADVMAGRLTPKDRQELVTESRTPKLERNFKSLTLDQALEVWGAMNPQEQAQNRAILIRKANAELVRYPAEDRDVLRQRIREALRMQPSGLPGFLRKARAAL